MNKRIILANFQVLSCMCDAIFFQQRGAGDWESAIEEMELCNCFELKVRYLAWLRKNSERDFLSVFTFTLFRFCILKQYFQALGSTREIVYSTAMTRVEGKGIFMLNFKVLWRIYLGCVARTLRGFIDFSFRKW